MDAKTAKSIGLVEYVLPPDKIDIKISEFVNSGKILTKPMKKKIEFPEKFKKLKDYFSDSNIMSILVGDEKLNEMGQKLAKTISYKAPIAIKLANKIIDEGSQLNLKEGLKLELSYLKEIFSTQDALEGLNSVIKKQRPNFKGM